MLALALLVVLPGGGALRAEAPEPPPSDDWGDMGEPDPTDPHAGDEPSQPTGDASDDWDFGTPSAPFVTPREPPRWRMHGVLRHRLGLWLDPAQARTLSTARTTLDASFDYHARPWRLVLSGRLELDPVYSEWAGERSAAVRAVYEYSLEPRRTYVELALPAFEATFGWQIINWGQGLLLSPLDLVSPKDLREPALADLDDLRRAVLATRLAVPLGDGRVELVAVHEAAFDRVAAPLGPYPIAAPFVPRAPEPGSPGERLTKADLSFGQRPERYSWDAQQLFLRGSVALSGLDLALHVGSVLDPLGVFDLGDIDPSAPLDAITIPLRHERMFVAGVSGAWVLPSVLLSWELAYSPDRPLLSLASEPGRGVTTELVALHVLDVMLGLTWDLSADTQLRLEIQDLTALGARAGDDFLFHPDVPQLALRLGHLMARQRLALEVIALAQADLHGLVQAVLRVGLDYRFADGLAAGLGSALFHRVRERTGLLSGLSQSDQVYVRFRWDFSLR